MIISISLLLYFLYSLLLLSFVYRYIIHPVFISPLSKLPNAHPTSTFLPTWLWYQTYSKNESRSILNAHRQHGPIVRLGPNEVSVASLEGLRKVYSGRKFVRTRWMVLPFLNYNGTRNLVTITDINEHAKRKKTMLQVYTKSPVMRSPDFQKLSAVILLERLLPLLSVAAKTGEGIDVYELTRAVAAEFGSAYELGLQNCLDIVRFGREQARRRYLEQCDRKMMMLKGHKEAKKWLEDQLLEMLAKTDAQLKATKSKNEKAEEDMANTYPIAYAHLDAAIATEYPALSIAEKLRIVASELLDNLEASREGDGIALTYAMHELSRQPKLQRELRAELRTIKPAFPTASPTLEPISAESLQGLDRLPLLDAIMRETLRVYSVSPGPQRRDVPPGGVTVEGYYIPAEVTISTSMRALHMNEEVFPNPEKWEPARWLQPKGERISEENDPAKWWWGFGSGARSCSGKDFAMLGMFFITKHDNVLANFILVIKLTLAAVYMKFDTEIVDDSGIEQVDDFMATPVGNQLILRFKSDA
jgi:hypothetical protein